MASETKWTCECTPRCGSLSACHDPRAVAPEDAACAFCGSDVYAPEEHEGPVYCGDECRKADGHAEAADWAADNVTEERV
jgi:hypothetical protein